MSSPPRPWLPIAYSPEYCAAGAPFDTTRKAAAIARSLGDEPIAGVHLIEPPPVTRSELARIHLPGYIDAVFTGRPRYLAASAGLGWDAGLLTGALAMTGGCIAAAERAWQQGIAGSLSSGAHHARKGSGDGYCTFNGVALAALTFLELGAGHVLIVDLDAHHGGGTHDILRRNAHVSQVDIATDDYDPYRAGNRWSRDLVTRAGDYLPTVIARLDTIDTTTIDAVIYNAGMDPHEGCNTGGLRGITDDLLAERERLVFEWARGAGLPIAFIVAGGYTSDALTSEHLTTLHRLTVEAAAEAPTSNGAQR